jgi:vancomycin resistance protein YoaR
LLVRMSAVTDRASRLALGSSHPVLRSALVGASLLVLVLVGLLGYRAAYQDRIYPGVRVGSLDVGGLTPVEAQGLLAGRLDPASPGPLIVNAAGQTWSLDRAKLGAHYDPAGLANLAFDVGRGGPIASRLVMPPGLRLRPLDVTAGIQLGPTDWSSELGGIAAVVDQPAVDAKLVVSPDHQVDVAPEREGRRLDDAAARKLIADALTSGAGGPVALPVVAVAPKVRASDLQAARAQAQKILAAPVEATYEGRTWELSVDDLQAGLVLTTSAGSPSASPSVDDAVVAAFVARIAGDVNRPAKSALLVLGGDQVALRPGQTALEVDVDATTRAVKAAISGDAKAVTPTVAQTNPAVGDADLQPALAQANALIGSPIEIDGPGAQKWTLTTAALRKMLLLGDSPAAQRDRPPHLDAQKLADYVAGIAKQVDVASFNARFQYAGTSLQLLRDAAPGQQVDRAQAASLIAAAAAGSQRVVALPVNPIAPAITAQDASKLAGLQLIAENTTSYAGSIPPRRHNVELATSLMNGVVVGPGETFSFDHELGPTTLDRGFQVGYGIVAQGGSVKTVPSVAGGICQVATTLFQPVFWTGYTIEERYWHAYWIEHYRSHGYAGLDDTVDPDSGLDFQFKNETSAPLLIQSFTADSTVHFQIYGVPPTWTVKVDPPVISNLIKTDRTLQVQYDPTMPRGQQVTTEAAEDGFSVLVRRTVTNADGTTRTLDLRSTYAPSHNVVMVGTKG